MSDVEFLAEDGAEEELEHAPGPRRPWWLLVAVALAVAAAVWVVSRPSDPHPVRQQAAPTLHPAPAASTTDATERICHGAPFCTASVLVPTDLRTVLLAYLPSRISYLRVRSYVAQSLNTGGAYLAEREINVASGSIELLITVQRIIGPVPEASQIVTAPAGTGSAIVHRTSGAFVIDLQYLAPESVPPSIGKLRVLVVDPRLEAL